MCSDLKSRLIGISIGIVGAGSYFALSYFFKFEPDQHWLAFFLCLAIVGIAIFIWWNRGKNMALLSALTGTDPMIIQHADGHLSGKCFRCGQKVLTEPSLVAPSEYKCPSCSLVVQLHGVRPDA